MAIFALMKDGLVKNLILADNDPEFLEHLRVIHEADEILPGESCRIGGAYIAPVVVAEDTDDADNA